VDKQIFHCCDRDLRRLRSPAINSTAIRAESESLLLGRSIGEERRTVSITTLRRLNENARLFRSRARKFHNEATLINSFASAHKRNLRDWEKPLGFGANISRRKDHAPIVATTDFCRSRASASGAIVMKAVCTRSAEIRRWCVAH
jgi:hypothetical protein